MKTQNFWRSNSRGFTYDPNIFAMTLEVSIASFNFSEILKAYRKHRENGDESDNPPYPFPSAGLDTFEIANSTYKPDGPHNKRFYPDSQDRYWLTFTLANGCIIEDFYWVKDKINGYPDKNDTDCYWFSIHHAPTGMEIGGFSITSDYTKGFPDKNGNYWCYIEYREGGKIQKWMEEKDNNYKKQNLQDSKLQVQKLAAEISDYHNRFFKLSVATPEVTSISITGEKLIAQELQEVDQNPLRSFGFSL